VEEKSQNLRTGREERGIIRGSKAESYIAHQGQPPSKKRERSREGKEGV